MATSSVPDNLDPIIASQRMPAGTDEAREIVDRNIQELNESVRAWKTYRNTLSVISCLPRELLAQIFLHLRDAVVASFNLNPFRPAPSSDRNRWIFPAHVCGHWREVALNCKALWASIGITDTTNSFDFCELQLQRSRPLPVDLIASFSISGRRLMVTKILTREPRINLNKLVLSGDDLGELLARLTFASSSLRHLCLKYANEVPKHLFAGETPQLRRLQIVSCCKVPWDAGIFRSQRLSYLHLERLSDKTLPSLSQLRQILLSVAPSIQVLVLLDSLPKDTTAEVSQSKPQLANLRRLQIHARPSSINPFLNIFHMPTSTIVEAEMNGYEYPPQALTARTAMAASVGQNILNFFAALSACLSSSHQFKRLSLLSKQWDHTLAQLFVEGYLTSGPDRPHTLNKPTLKLTYTHTNFDMRFRGVDDPCASCGRKVHSVLAKRWHGEPRQSVDASMCDGCTGSCHYRPWLPMLLQEENPIPGLSLDGLEVLDLEQELVSPRASTTRVPTGFWNTLAHIPKLRDITIRRFCAGRFGEIWMNDSTSFPALKHLKFDEVLVPPILIKRLRDGLEARHGDPDRHLHTLEFTDKCDELSLQDLEGILGQYVPTLKAPKERKLSANHPWEWPPPPEETADARFNRHALELGYSRSRPPSAGDCSR